MTANRIPSAVSVPIAIGLVITVFPVAAIAQKSHRANSGRTPAAIPTFRVQFEADPNLTTPFQDSLAAVTSDGCSSDGEPYVRVFRFPSKNEVLRFGSQGLVTFETAKITDVVEPKFISDFITESSLYMLIEGDTHVEQNTKTFEHGEQEVTWETKGIPKYYIARFDLDGTYRSVQKLDLPFHPRILSGFPSGSFIAAGEDENNVFRVGLLDSSGQLLRLIRFPHQKEELASRTVARSLGLKSSEDTASWLLSLDTTFLQYQSNVFYIRGRSGQPVSEIRENGEALSRKIELPEGYTVEYMLPSDRNLFVVSSEVGQFSDAKSVLYEINPDNGELVGRYLAEGTGRVKSMSDSEGDVSCVQENRFIAVRHEHGKLEVLRGTPVLIKPGINAPATP